MLVVVIKSSWLNCVKRWQIWAMTRLKPTLIAAISSLIQPRIEGDIVAEFQTFFTERYPFVEQFALLDAKDYQAEIDQLPEWWQEELARKDVLFFTEGLDKQAMVDYIQSLHLGDEVLHLSEHAIYWGKYTEGSYLQTAYHKQLAKSPFYKQVTIRNVKTFSVISNYLKNEIKR